MSSRIEVVSRVSGRRRWTVDQKLAVLRDAFGPEGCVRAACERHDVGSGSIYTWRRQAMSGELAGVRKPIEPVFAEVATLVEFGLTDDWQHMIDSTTVRGHVSAAGAKGGLIRRLLVDHAAALRAKSTPAVTIRDALLASS